MLIKFKYKIVRKKKLMSKGTDKNAESAFKL